MKRFIAVGLIAATGAAASAQTLYSVREGDDTLVRIDISNPNAPTFADVGALGVRFDFGGLSFGPGGDLYMIDGRGGRAALYTVDTGTGTASFVGAHGINDLFALAWDTSTGTMYASQFAGGSGLYTLDPSTGAPTTINPAMSAGIGGLTYNFSTDQLVGSNDGAGDLYDIDRATGAQTLIFDGPFVNDSGLAYDAMNNYYWGIDWSGVLFYYDIGAGYARTDVLTGLGAHDGLAWVPAPGSLALLGLGGLAAARRRRG